MEQSQLGFQIQKPYGCDVEGEPNTPLWMVTQEPQFDHQHNAKILADFSHTTIGH
jgi:hypothetical protein